MIHVTASSVLTPIPPLKPLQSCSRCRATRGCDRLQSSRKTGTCALSARPHHPGGERYALDRSLALLGSGHGLWHSRGDPGVLVWR
ncbi:hypothetical protein C4K13_2923 [Pseudomonas chlororaphis subsp. aureofaciens]|nr:hypothetical protein C4K13_2923 [Pseudomonas chlororaphis subsp. aureofaciens]